ncbi:RNA polymerase ECF-subfamily sigma factor [Corynebacterium kutscheri]|uniref:RNA polymerase ECF-subfamily sigma factor n=1 Tax=Corynebacterium kutscheri TaxID=35755 RepID=A0A0F6TEY6_9CORY|nr:RNA polymerase sigma factor [Corynebacterium kutscheri]AKE42224.1 RNA polymerase sigma factor, sigma-70 family [Corynebacterium kutscheri]VEH05727.1 RNA polymerase ECF-subfamily sigma factor [Corynebacterium kutscheri]VEH10567.1 RNA polymerase ECF-subfamily sigma factor [Corynebacterium kutscheri]VEH81623.1 RNA polymerase ECF-subfamily sigma factor [Corynebacterium kutscheri]
MRISSTEQVREEFSDIYRQTYPRIRAYFRRRVNKELVDDLTAETFARAWRKWHSRKGEPMPWIYGIAHHVVLEAYRANPPQLFDDLSFMSAYSEDIADEVSTSVDIYRALRRLSETDREILTLHAWEGLEPKELAEVLQVGGTQARVRLHRARKRLAQGVKNSESY